MSRFHNLTGLLMLIAILAGTTNFADAKPASGAVAGALGAAAAKNVGKGAITHCVRSPDITLKSGNKVTNIVTCTY